LAPVLTVLPVLPVLWILALVVFYVSREVHDMYIYSIGSKPVACKHCGYEGVWAKENDWNNYHIIVKEPACKPEAGTLLNVPDGCWHDPASCRQKKWTTA
jgi:hypothetical protein